MHDADADRARRLGTSRVRQLTAAVALAAVTGTGLISWALADQAAAAQSPSPAPAPVVGSGDDDGGLRSTDGFSAPGHLPTPSGSGPVHASSGGS